MVKARIYIQIYTILLLYFILAGVIIGDSDIQLRPLIVNTAVSPAAIERLHSAADKLTGNLQPGRHLNNKDLSISSSVSRTASAPDNDNCVDIVPQTLPLSISGDNSGATNDCDLFLKGTQVWEAFMIDDKMDVAISYCGTGPAFEVVYTILIAGCPCEEQIIAHAANWETCGDGNITIYYYGLAPGTYYIPILASHPDFTDYYFTGPYTINVNAEPFQDRICDATASVCDEYISRVHFVSIDNSSGCNGYSDYTHLSTLADFGASYPITIEIEDGFANDYGAVWIDWNQNQDFSDADEQINLDVFQGPGPYYGTVTVPPTARAGETRMRVRLNYGAPPNPCGVTSYGEVEDYKIEVGGQPSYLTISHDALDLGWVLPGDTSFERLFLGASGQSAIYFNIDFVYNIQESVGGIDAGPYSRYNPIISNGYVTTDSKGATSLFEEDFESGLMPPAGWEVVANNDYTWTIGGDDPYQGNFYARCRFDEYLNGMQNEWLVTPAIDLEGKDYQLDFWWNGSYFHSVTRNTCTLAVWISTDGGLTYNEKLWDNHQYGEFAEWQWNNTIISLSTYSDESNIRLAFVYTGEDGADFNIDAVKIYLKPSPWLRASPWIGRIDPYRQIVVTIAGTSKNLELGQYNAEAIITHTGASNNKSVSHIPVKFYVGVAAGVTISPDPVNVLDAHKIAPPAGYVFIHPGLLPGGYTPEDVNASTVRINSIVVPTEAEFIGEVFAFKYSLADFVQTYPILWNTSNQAFDISGEFNDGTPFTLNYSVDFIGYTAGDANLDGNVNVADIVAIGNYVFRMFPVPKVLETADANCDGSVNISDAAYLTQFVFHEGSPPCHTK